MDIRAAEKKDIPRILELLIQVNNVHSDGRPDLFIRDKTKYTETQLLSLFMDKTSPVFVAADENDIVQGYCFCILQSHREDPNWPDITTLYIDDLCVDEACRGQHIGKALYESVKAYAKAIGCYNITLNVWEKNGSARGFYDSLGLLPQKTCLEEIL